jgi:hypothetical protein
MSINKECDYYTRNDMDTADLCTRGTVGIILDCGDCNRNKTVADSPNESDSEGEN